MKFTLAPLNGEGQAYHIMGLVLVNNFKHCVDRPVLDAAVQALGNHQHPQPWASAPAGRILGSHPMYSSGKGQPTP